MDLNYLLHRHQVSLMRATAAQSREARFAHHGMARCYADAIQTLQRSAGAAMAEVR